ncbi:MAG: hypothetical protein L0Y71_13440 [Gemmataceae bacterium]|nr:hypothetical protein [Gemmataceae bacterium]
MTKKEFQDGLRQLLRSEPFFPFAVELRDGRKIIIRKPPLAFNDEGASFIDSTDGALVEFERNQVKKFTLLTPETVA